MKLKENTMTRRVGPKTDKAVQSFMKMIEEATGLKISYPQATDAREMLQQRDETKLYTCEYVITIKAVRKTR